MTDYPTEGPVSARRELRVNDADRDAVVADIQQAMVEGYLQFDELDMRFAAVYRAQTRGDLDDVVVDLPRTRAPAPTAHHPISDRTLNLIGDVRKGGWISVGSAMQVISLIGDAVIDLSSAEIPDGGVTVTVYSLIGDVRAIVPDGAQVQIESLSVIGDSRDRLVAPMAGGPRITLRLRSLIGDVRVYSLSQVPEGRLRALWNTLRRA